MGKYVRICIYTWCVCIYIYIKPLCRVIDYLLIYTYNYTCVYTNAMYRIAYNVIIKAQYTPVLKTV